MTLVRLAPSTALKEKRLRALLGSDRLDSGDAPHIPASARRDLDDACVLGSLELSGLALSWSDVTADRREEELPAPAMALKAAQRAVDPEAGFSVDTLETWQRALFGNAVYRDEAAHRPSLELLEDWMAAPSTRSLSPGRQGALVLARLVELRPFGEGSGRLSRLAASHVMVRSGARPPVLVGADRPRLDAALREAVELRTEYLVALLDEGSERALDVLLQSLDPTKAAR